MIKDNRKEKSFGFKRFTNMKSTIILIFVNINKQLNLDKKRIKFIAMLI